MTFTGQNSLMATLREQALKQVLDERSITLRKMILGAVASGGRGHLGPALSLLEIVSTLYDSVLNHDPKNHSWSERDVFILSKGHGCLGLYAVLAQHGYFPMDELNTFCQFRSRLGGHPEWHELEGIEFSTGSLGHGPAVAVGICRAFQLQKSARRVFVLVGDGELGEGAIWESALHASKYSMSNLTMIIDFNNMQAYGEILRVLPLESIREKFQAFGFLVEEINGHSRDSILGAIRKEHIGNKPKVVIAHTIKGKGIKSAENATDWHHRARISQSDIEKLTSELI
jgi:transketolase